MTPATTTASNAPAAGKLSAARTPWWWVPSLYFSQGVPYVIVMQMTKVMYKRLGVSNTDITFYTSLLYWAWVIKPLWSPFVDTTRTKRAWVVSMQFVVSLGLGLAAFAVHGSNFLTWSLIFFAIMAFASATHDIAADGFYMLSLSKHEQAWWVGLRSTFYRTAMIVGSGLLVVLAGSLEGRNGLPAADIPVQASTTAPLVSAWDPATIKFPAEQGEQRVLVQPASLAIPLTERSAGDAKAVISQAREWNREHGFVAPEKPVAAKADSRAPSWWSSHVTGPFGAFLASHFPKAVKSAAAPAVASGNVGVLYVALARPVAAGQEVTVNLGRKPRGVEKLGLVKNDNSFSLKEGERLVFNSSNWNQPAMAVIQLDPNLKADTAVTFVTSSGNIPLAWSLTLFFVAALFLAFTCWHSFVLPRPPNDGPVLTHHSLTAEFFATLISFFRKPGVGLAIAFFLLYRFDEAQLTNVNSLFLLDSRDAGGLGLTTSQVGVANGIFGILALTCGGLLGGFTAAKYGLRRMLPIMVISMYLPKLAYLFLSWTQPANFLLTCGAVAAEQFGYGFGFTAFMLYMLLFADGPHKTAHYALCTGFMALGMMVPGFWSGWVADLVGYKHFFVWVICSALPGFTLAMVLNRRIDPQFGKKTG
ncbi:MAG TPA: hypothetical protein VMU04_12135 [Candidatus Acidoferrum sp.]|nr:hypothetical protein [Candidatus Acidoferrum sp.]